MATAAELARPGVEVIQSIRKASPTFLRPTLAPVVVGPAFELIEALTSDGTLNSKALYGAYAQLGKTISQSSFPDPRGNVDELDVLEETIKAYLFTAGRLTELPMAPGDAFLLSAHKASSAVLKATGNNFAVQGKNIVLAVDQPVAASTATDVTVAFTGVAPYTAAEVVAAINTAFGFELAAVTKDGAGVVTGFELVSPSAGAISSLTVRGGGTANAVLGLGHDGADPVQERVEGSGFRAFDLSNNTTVSTWIEFFQGEFTRGSTASGADPWPDKAQRRTLAGLDVQARDTAVQFGTGAGQIPVVVGDQVVADGIVVKSGEIARVEADKIKIGTVNPLLSSADSDGNYTNKVYDDVSLGLLFDANTPFSPKYMWFKANGLSPNASATAAKVTGTATATAATKPTVTGQADATPGVLQGLGLDYTVTAAGVTTTKHFTFAQAGAFDTVGEIADYISAGVDDLVVTVLASKLVFTGTTAGADQSIALLESGSVNASLGITAALSDTGTDPEIAALPSKTLKFSFDDSDHVYDVSFTDKSLTQAIERINSVVGATVASNVADQLVLTSQLKGVASKVLVVSGSGLTDLGFTEGQSSDTGTKGTGRPNPNAYLDGANNLVVESQLVRDPVTGAPLDFMTSSAQLYIQYKGLRRDVSPAAKVAGVLRLPGVDTLSSVLDPVDARNPLALGMYLAMLNAPNFEVKGLGVDEVSAAAPEGTELAYARAAAFLEAEEVYAIAPLTQSEVAHQTFITHATLMSEPEQAGERIVFFSKKTPVTKTPAAAANGVSASATATPNQLRVDVTPQQGLVDAGVNPAQAFPASTGVYIEFNWKGVFYRYNVSSVNGGLINLRTSFGAGENDDFYYSTVALPTDVLDATWALKVRGASVMIPGSNPPKTDYSVVADTVAEANGGVGNRRAFSVFPDTVKTTLAGIEVEIPGYYACAAAAGMVAGLPPQQGFTNYPITGLTGVSGTEKYTRKQLNKMAGGGTYILMQEVAGGPVFSRHQLSTDTSSVEVRELSVTKVVDFVAKFLRAGLRRFIGRQNINAVFLDSVGTTIQGMLQFLTENGIINGANLNNIIQDPKAPDTVMVDVTLDVPFPCNYIRLTLVV